MKIYIRRINRNEWPDKISKEMLFNKRIINSDGITRDLRTENNELSFWEFDVDSVKNNEQGKLRIYPEKIENEIIVTLGLIGNGYNTTRCLYFLEKDLRKYKIVVNENSGKTLYELGKKHHVNLHHINYFFLGDLSKKIVRKIYHKQIINYPRAEIIKKTACFINLGKIATVDLIIPMDKMQYDQCGRIIDDKGEFYEEIEKKRNNREYMSDIDRYIAKIYSIWGIAGFLGFLWDTRDKNFPSNDE